MSAESGKLIIFIGFGIIVVGAIIYFFGDKLNFIGNLPGDIRIEKENFRFYFPITTMLLLSLLFNLIMRAVRYFF